MAKSTAPPCSVAITSRPSSLRAVASRTWSDGVEAGDGRDLPAALAEGEHVVRHGDVLVEESHYGSRITTTDASSWRRPAH